MKYAAWNMILIKLFITKIITKYICELWIIYSSMKSYFPSQGNDLDVSLVRSNYLLHLFNIVFSNCSSI